MALNPMIGKTKTMPAPGYHLGKRAKPKRWPAESIRKQVGLCIPQSNRNRLIPSWKPKVRSLSRKDIGAYPEARQLCGLPEPQQ